MKRQGTKLLRLFIMKKAILLLLILALIVSSTGCAGKNDKETRIQKAPDSHELRSNATQAANTSQPTASPTDVEGSLYAEWKYIDPALVAVTGEEDEKVTDS
jgi:septal ring-binding cell division protein DamX